MNARFPSTHHSSSPINKILWFLNNHIPNIDPDEWKTTDWNKKKKNKDVLLHVKKNLLFVLYHFMLISFSNRATNTCTILFSSRSYIIFYKALILLLYLKIWQKKIWNFTSSNFAFDLNAQAIYVVLLFIFGSFFYIIFFLNESRGIWLDCFCDLFDFFYCCELSVGGKKSDLGALSLKWIK